MIERPRIDVPGVVILGQILEGLKLVAARARRQRFEFGFLVVQAGNAARLTVDHYLDVGVFKRQPLRLQVACELLRSRNHMQHFVPQRGHIAHIDQKLVAIGLCIALQNLRRNHVTRRVEH